MEIALIYMASGFGKRYGSNKLMEMYHGKPLYQYGLFMLQEVKKLLDAAGHTVSICTVTNQEEIFKMGCKFGASYWNERAEEGIAASVRLGVREASECEADLAAFFVADQPWLTAESVYRLFGELIQSEKTIGRVAANGVPGNPVIFDRKYFPELGRVSGDQGGRQIMKKHPDDILYFEVAERELRDIDYPEDWEEQ